MRRRILFVLALALIVGGAGWWWFWRPHGVQGTVWQGYAEADFVKVGPQQAGRLTAVSVERGDVVKVGTPLFTQDDTGDKAAALQASREHAAATQRLANLQAAGRPTEIRQAEANLADAQATLHRIEDDLTRNETLLKGGFASVQATDLLRAQRQSAQAKVHALEAMLTQIRQPIGRPEEIAAQRAAMEAADAALEAANWRLSQRHVTSPVAGRVADVLARAGEMMAAGAPVVSLLPPGNIRVRFFVPEPALSSVHMGEPVTFSCDGCQAGLTGTISFIAPEPEYTPPVIYSEASRAKLVFMVEARPPADQATLLNPGQPMQVRPGPP